MDDLTSEERFQGLPDDPDEQQRVLGMVRKLDPDARIHHCSLPTGALLEVHNVQAAVLARMIIDGFRPNKFEVNEAGRPRR